MEVDVGDLLLIFNSQNYAKTGAFGYTRQKELGESVTLLKKFSF